MEIIIACLFAIKERVQINVTHMLPPTWPVFCGKTDFEFDTHNQNAN
jgi:hypothetical protein